MNLFLLTHSSVGSVFNNTVRIQHQPVIIFQIPRRKWPLANSRRAGMRPPFMPPEIYMLRKGAPAEDASFISSTELSMVN